MKPYTRAGITYNAEIGAPKEGYPARRARSMYHRPAIAPLEDIRRIASRLILPRLDLAVIKRDKI